MALATVGSDTRTVRLGPGPVAHRSVAPNVESLAQMPPSRHNDRLFRRLATALIAVCLAMLAHGRLRVGRRAPVRRDTAGCRDCSPRTASGTSPSPGTRAIDPDSQADRRLPEPGGESGGGGAHRAVDHDGQLQHPLYIAGPKHAAREGRALGTRARPGARACSRRSPRSRFRPTPAPPPGPTGT